MAGTSSYPAGYDALNNPTSTTTQDASGYEHDVQHTVVNDAVESIEAELGLLPKGAKATVRARLDDVDTAIAAISTELGSDPSGGTYATVKDRLDAMSSSITTLTTNHTGVSRVFVGTSAPGSPVDGDCWIDTTGL